MPVAKAQINLLARDSVCFYPVEKTHRREGEVLTDHATIIGSLHRRVVDCRRQDATCKLQRTRYRSVLKNLAVSGGQLRSIFTRLIPIKGTRIHIFWVFPGRQNLSRHVTDLRN
jgi:hypothetical protein